MQKPDTTKQVIDDIFHLISSGQLEQAEHKCSSMLVNHPQDVNIIGLHGAILLKLGRIDEALVALQSAIALEPEFAKPHEDLGRLFLIRNEPDQAARHFSQAIRLDDSQASAYGGLASALTQLGRRKEAESAHQQFMELSPVAGTLLEADQLLHDGDTAQAEQLCSELLRREPDDTRVLRMLARIASDDERYGVAEQLLRRIIALSPNECLPHTELGRFLVEQSRFPEAIEMFELATSLNEGSADNHRLLGEALAMIGRSADALTFYQQALRLDPEDPHSLAGQGHMLRITGNSDDAIACYEKCTVVQPGFSDAWWSLASLKDYRLSDEQVQTIHKQIASGDLGTDSEIAMRFALARTSEARGEYEAAWQDYSRGNSLKRESINHDPEQTERMHDAIIKRFSSDFLGHKTPAAASMHTPVFILGMPRSGSTLIEQILASHSKVEGAGELPYVNMLSSTLGRQRLDGPRYPELMSELTEEQLESLGKAYIYHSSVHRRQGLPYLTDKMPANFSHIGLIHMMLPKAKIIDVRRHPLGTCLANYRQLYALGKNQTYDLVELAEYYLEYRRMMDHWQEVLPGRVLQVNYEEVVADLESQVRRLLDYCELPWEDVCLDFHKNTRPVNTASAEQVRQPIYTDAIDFWKHYELQLEPARKILEPVLSR
jgi:tetratricopeptide (TPR) repeat protein